MKVFTTAAVLFIAAVWLAVPTIELHLALQGPGERPKNPSVIMLGDSHTEFVNWGLLLHCKGILNLGIGGNTTSQMLTRLPDALTLNPRLLIVMGGTNDALQHIAPQTTANNLRQMGNMAKANSVRFISLTPPQAGNPIGVGDLSIPFTRDDLLSDHIHLRASGYAKWRDTLTPIVREYC